MNARARRGTGLMSLAGAALGALVGGALGVGVPLILARVTSRALMSYEALALVLAPGAYLVSWVTGWSMQQESALLCYGLSLVLTPLVLGALVGGALGALWGDRGPNGDART